MSNRTWILHTHFKYNILGISSPCPRLKFFFFEKHLHIYWLIKRVRMSTHSSRTTSNVFPIGCKWYQFITNMSYIFFYIRLIILTVRTQFEWTANLSTVILMWGAPKICTWRSASFSDTCDFMGKKHEIIALHFRLRRHCRHFKELNYETQRQKHMTVINCQCDLSWCRERLLSDTEISHKFRDRILFKSWTISAMKLFWVINCHSIGFDFVPDNGMSVCLRTPRGAVHQPRPLRHWVARAAPVHACATGAPSSAWPQKNQHRKFGHHMNRRQNEKALLGSDAHRSSCWISVWRVFPLTNSTKSQVGDTSTQFWNSLNDVKGHTELGVNVSPPRNPLKLEGDHGGFGLGLRGRYLCLCILHRHGCSRTIGHRSPKGCPAPCFTTQNQQEQVCLSRLVSMYGCDNSAVRLKSPCKHPVLNRPQRHNEHELCNSAKWSARWISWWFGNCNQTCGGQPTQIGVRRIPASKFSAARRFQPVLSRASNDFHIVGTLLFWGFVSTHFSSLTTSGSLAKNFNTWYSACWAPKWAGKL